MAADERIERILAKLDKAIATLDVLQARLRWKPMKDAPRDGTVIEAWHVFYRCPVAIFYNPQLSEKEDLPWVTATKDRCWPEESFTVWRLISFSPEGTSYEPVQASSGGERLSESGNIR